MSAHYAAEADPKNKSDNSESPDVGIFAVEVHAAPASDTLLRVLNPLQKLDVTPLLVRAGEAFDAVGEGMMKIEVHFRGTPYLADQVQRNMASSIHVASVNLMRCSR